MSENNEWRADHTISKELEAGLRKIKTEVTSVKTPSAEIKSYIAAKEQHFRDNTNSVGDHVFVDEKPTTEFDIEITGQNFAIEDILPGEEEKVIKEIFKSIYKI